MPRPITEKEPMVSLAFRTFEFLFYYLLIVVVDSYKLAEDEHPQRSSARQK